jgi:hypothetical protein
MIRAISISNSNSISIPNRTALAPPATSPGEAGGGLSERSKLREGAKSLS